MATQKSHKCPRCGYEYEPWVEVCPDCSAPIRDAEWSDLAAAKEGPPGGSNPRWTVATNVPNAIIGNLIKSQLEDAGIPVLMLRSPSADVAQFSHNDFVPYDLRVPADLLDEARRLIDSEPGDEYGPWSDFEDESDQEDDYPDEDRGDLPEGWRVLPTAEDIRARQEARRAHGESVRGWGWADDDRPDAWRGEQPQYRPASPYEEEPYYRGEGWSGRSRWVRIIYGILLAAISLPFIIELLRQLWTMLGGFR